MISSIIISKEFAFAVLLLSGTIKMLLPLIGITGIPDLTLLSAIGVTIIMMNQMRLTITEISKKRFELIIILTLFYLFMIYSLSYSSSNHASIIKTINFGTMALAFYFPLLVKDFNIKKFMISITGLIFICSVIFLNFYTSYLNRDEAMILTMGEENAIQMTALYLTISWLNGILALYYFFKSNQNPIIRWVLLIIAFVFLISAGGRGPLIFTILILGFYFLTQIFQILFTFKFNRLLLPVIFLITVTSSTIFIVSNSDITKYNPSLKLVDHTVKRLMGLVNEKGGGASAHNRVTNAIFSIKKIDQSPFWGYGVGSYAYELKHRDYLDYPHNIFLEVWFELGYIPLLLFLFLFYRVYSHIRSIECLWCLALYFYFLLNILKSSSLIDIRMMLGFYAIFITIQYIQKEEESIKKSRIKNE